MSPSVQPVRLVPPLAPLALPTDGVLRVPCSGPVEVRCASLDDRARFLDGDRWRTFQTQADPEDPGWRVCDLDALGLPDGDYEYELSLPSGGAVPDPFAEEIVRFGGYRGLFHVRGGRRWRAPFSWDGELPPGVTLPRNHELVIYEVPLRWMDNGDVEQLRQVGLGTFDKLLFEHLDAIAQLGVNAIELLPVQDSPDTLNWGYGTRFFFTTDLDMGQPVDLKVLVKECHRRGIRVLLDVVMNHSRGCPLAALARDRYYAKGNAQEGRDAWGGDLFWFDSPVEGRHHARELHERMGELWVREFHVDGFRIDEFKGIKNWEFVQGFRDRTTAAQAALFPERPFIVIAEDSSRTEVITRDAWPNPGNRRTVDAAWNFGFQDDVRRLLTDSLETRWGEASRSKRIEALLSGFGGWDLARAINYEGSHDVQANPRFMNLVLERILARMDVEPRDWDAIRRVVDDLPQAAPPAGKKAATPEQARIARDEALERAAGAHALVLTAVGVPMVLAGAEFGDVHDTDYTQWQLKMSDPVNFARRERPGHKVLLERVKELVLLRRRHPALLRSELDLFYRHPRLDEPGGERVFAYCRTAGLPLGSPGQVIVLANMGPQEFPEFVFPAWPWARVTERGAGPRGAPLRTAPGQPQMATSLAPFQVRVFEA